MPNEPWEILEVTSFEKAQKASSEGWELVSVVVIPDPRGGGPSSLLFYLKRRLPWSDPERDEAR